MLRPPVTEEARRGAVARLAGQFPQSGEADELGHLHIGVEPGILVLLRAQRVEHAGIPDPLDDFQPAAILRAVPLGRGPTIVNMVAGRVRHGTGA